MSSCTMAVIQCGPTLVELQTDGYRFGFIASFPWGDAWNE